MRARQQTPRVVSRPAGVEHDQRIFYTSTPRKIPPKLIFTIHGRYVIFLH